MNAANEIGSGESTDDLRSFLAYLKQDPEVKRKIEAELIKGLPSSAIVDDGAYWAELRRQFLDKHPELKTD